MILLGANTGGSFGVEYMREKDVPHNLAEKVKGTYQVPVKEAWFNAAHAKYDAAYLGDIAVREVLQNSLDAVMQALANGEITKGHVNITTYGAEGGRQAPYENFDGYFSHADLIGKGRAHYAMGYTAEDNGVGMSDTDINDKFLSLHISGKSKLTSFGGFGVANAVVLGPSASAFWVLHTRDNYFDHQKALDNKQIETTEARQGTRLTVMTQEDIISPKAKMYLAATETPKNIDLIFNGKKLARDVFAKTKPIDFLLAEDGNSKMQMTYYPKPPKELFRDEKGFIRKDQADINKGWRIIRLVDPISKIKLTQGIERIWTENFKGVVLIDITTTESPNTEDYPLTDSRNDVRGSLRQHIAGFIDRNTKEQKERPESRRVKIANFRSWKGKADKIENDTSYQNLAKTIIQLHRDTGLYHGTSVRAFTWLRDLEAEVEIGFKGYAGGSVWHAKHMMAFEAMARLTASVTATHVENVEIILQNKPPQAHYNKGTLTMGLNPFSIRVERDARNPRAYAFYIIGLIHHELSHYEFSGHGEDFSIQREELQRRFTDEWPSIMKIARELIDGSTPDAMIVDKDTGDVTGIKPTKTEKVTGVLSEEEIDLFNDVSTSGGIDDDLFYPNDTGEGRQGELIGRRVGDSNARRDSKERPVRTRGDARKQGRQDVGTGNKRGVAAREGKVAVPAKYKRIVKATGITYLGTYNDIVAFKPSTESPAAGHVLVLNKKKFSARNILEAIANMVTEIVGNEGGFIANPFRKRTEDAVKGEGPVKTKDGRWLYRIVHTKWRSAWSDFWFMWAKVPNSADALFRRYRLLGGLDKVERTITHVFDRLKVFDRQTNGLIFEYLRGQVGLHDVPQEAQRLAKAIMRLNTQIGKAMVERGLITEKVRQKHEGRYVHYLYAKHVLGDKADYLMSPTAKLDLGPTIGRKKGMTEYQRDVAGLIRDASIAVPIGMGKALSDMVKHDYLKDILLNEDWTWHPSYRQIPMPDGSVRTLSIGKLVQEVKDLEKLSEEFPDDAIKADNLERHRKALEEAQEETKNMPEDFKLVPTSPSYGPLSGAFVRREIVDDLIPLSGGLDVHSGEAYKTVMAAITHSTTIFKAVKVALNPPTAVRNIISNFIQNNIRPGGPPLRKIPSHVVQAVKAIRNKDKFYKEARRNGVFRTNFSVVEVDEILSRFAAVDDTAWSTFIDAIRYLSQYYGKIDDIAKLTIYHQMRRDGHSEQVSTLEAQEWGMDYSLAPRSVRQARRNVLPFSTYQYKIAPLLYKSLTNQPWKIGKFITAAPIIAAATALRYGLDEEDWDELLKNLPAYIQKEKSFIIMPWKNKEDQWQWVNLEYFFPWGNWAGLFKDASAGEIGRVFKGLGFSNPAFSIASVIATTVHKPPIDDFTGKPIYNMLNTPEVKVAKMMEWLQTKWMPSALTGKGAYPSSKAALQDLAYRLSKEKIGKPLEADRWGTKISGGQALAKWFGVNITSINPEQVAAGKKARLKELRIEYSRLKSDPKSTERDIENAQRIILQLQGEVTEGVPRRVDLSREAIKRVNRLR